MTLENRVFRYTIGFIFDRTFSNVLLVHKKKPAWMSGFLNGIGGKVEMGESPAVCVRRESREEAGLDISEWTYCGTIIQREREDYANVAVFAARYQGEHTDAIKRDYEEIQWFPVFTLPKETLQPWLILLAHEKLSRKAPFEEPLTEFTVVYP